MVGRILVFFRNFSAGPALGRTPSRALQLPAKRLEWKPFDSGPRDDDYINARRQAGARPKGRPQTPADEVPEHRLPDPPGNRQPQARPPARFPVRGRTRGIKPVTTRSIGRRL